MNNFDRAEKACYDRLKRAKKDTKTAREIGFEKKLDIAVKALKKLSEETLLTENGGRFVNSSASIAQQALKEIEG